jgi:CRP/FNR family cyclic AMP-dependent transcriptional regulator
VPSLEEQLAVHPFSRGFTPQQSRILASCLDGESTWVTDAFIVSADGEADHCYLLVHGAAVISADSPGRGRRSIQTIHAGDVVGWSWLFPPHRWAFDATALTETRAIVLDGARLRIAIDDDPAFGLEVVRRVGSLVADRLNATRLQLLDLYGNRG